MRVCPGGDDPPTDYRKHNSSVTQSTPSAELRDFNVGLEQSDEVGARRDPVTLKAVEAMGSWRRPTGIM
jgi:hypothetical protein